MILNSDDVVIGFVEVSAPVQQAGYTTVPDGVEPSSMIGKTYRDGQFSDVIHTDADAPGQAYKNAFLMICDQLMSRSTHEKLSFEELGPIMKALKATNSAAYDNTRDMLMTINMALINKCGTNWWDNCDWSEDATVLAQAQAIVS